MAVPNSESWGSIVNNYGRIGLDVKLSNTSTQTTVTVEVWFWSKWSVQSSAGTLYYDDGATNATTSKGKITVETYNNSTWHTNNQIKIATYTHTFSRGNVSTTRNVAAKLSGVALINSAMTVTVPYTIPALDAVTCTISYNANGGVGAPSSHSYTYAESGTTNLSETVPSRTGYVFLGWSLSPTATAASYTAGQAWNLNNKDDYTLYAVWQVRTYTNRIKHWKYVGTGGNNDRGDFYSNSDEDNLFTAVYNSTVTIPSNLVKPYVGYHNSGLAGGKYGGSSYINKNVGDTFTQPASDVVMDYIYYPNEYTVHFDGNGATGGSTADMVMTYNKEAVLNANGFFKENYTFVGWSTLPNSGVHYTDGATVKNLSSGAAVTLYAVWKHNLFDNHTKAYIKTSHGVKPHKLMVFDGTNWVHYKSSIKQ